ncbi:DUF3014 domain-containing protein [Psychromonas sp. Urea-02u-13]|uniref:DUF3014 domain-containing protein n=1 Tax=Psychromonas sp. Urea-02u-13 TaxID=2058326 RepID=UPI000C34E6E4|nr:DUF3014 domain-containing protein [Psychromonas sp. Urea-02u-13]PKG37619.1 hypothetical protein CXF74_17985 [Psychromonas sp. Urea-02u-13]
MSVIKEKSNKPLKVTVVVLGGFLIAASITPYINSYLLSNDNTESVIESETATATSQQLEIENTVSAQQDIESVTNSDTSSAQQTSKAVTTTPQQEKVILPALHDSDAFFLKNIKTADTKSLFVPLDIIRNMVVFVDNFSSGELVNNFNPLETPVKSFSVNEQKGIVTIDSDSYLRYDKYAQAISEIDTQTFIDLYSLLSPLIDQAYQEIGYPAGSFNHTFDKAIDHLLETPIIQYKLALSSDSVMYKYADKNLESLPDTQKQMLRMGPDNLQIIKQKLQEIQSELQRL